MAAFFKGVQPSVAGVIPYAAVNLGMYDGLRKVTTPHPSQVPY